MHSLNTFKQEGNVLIHTRLLDAPRELVWEVWTNPVHLKEWWGPDGFSLTTESMDVAPGKSWNFTMHGWSRDWDNKIEYIEVNRPSLISYKHSGKDADYDFHVSVSFEEVQRKTLLTMRSTFASSEIIEELNRKVNALEGGKQTLNRLQHYLKTLINEK
jgi:uncharacterized protein YndB with AHSA1/START domain